MMQDLKTYSVKRDRKDREHLFMEENKQMRPRVRILGYVKGYCKWIKEDAHDTK